MPAKTAVAPPQPLQIIEEKIEKKSKEGNKQ